MWPTLQQGETVILDKRAYVHAGPARGDIAGIRFVTLNTPIIKRVIAVPADRFQRIAGKVHLNGEIISEPYLARSRDWHREKLELLLQQLEASHGIVPEGQYVVLGDQAGPDLDSGKFGLVSRRQIIGKLVAVKNEAGEVVYRHSLPNPDIELSRIRQRLNQAH